MTTYQFSKCDVFSADKHARGSSAFSAWVRTHYAGKFIVSVTPYDSDGAFNIEPLRARGYEFSGAGVNHIERGLLAGKKRWFKCFDSEAAADAEIDALCGSGI